MPEKRKNPMKIFICDDEEKMVEDLASIIQDKMQGRVEEGDIFTFVNSPKLWQALQTKPCDVLFLDIDMPQMSGLDIAEDVCFLHRYDSVYNSGNHPNNQYSGVDCYDWLFCVQHGRNVSGRKRYWWMQNSCNPTGCCIRKWYHREFFNMK